MKKLPSKSVMQYGEDKVQVNQPHLFDRLVKISPDFMSDMKHELPLHPSALLDNCGMMCMGSKQQYCKVISGTKFCHIINFGCNGTMAGPLVIFTRFMVAM